MPTLPVDPIFVQNTLPQLVARVQDIIGVQFVAGNNVTITANTASKTLIISSTGGGGNSDFANNANHANVADLATVALLANNGTYFGGQLPAYYLDSSHLTGTINALVLPIANTTVNGIVTIAAQSFAGVKTFTANLFVNGLLTVNANVSANLIAAGQETINAVSNANFMAGTAFGSVLGAPTAALIRTNPNLNWHLAFDDGFNNNLSIGALEYGQGQLIFGLPDGSGSYTTPFTVASTAGVFVNGLLTVNANVVIANLVTATSNSTVSQWTVNANVLCVGALVNVATGNVHVGNAITVDGLTTLTGNTTFGGYVNVASTLQVTGIATFSANVTVAGNALFQGALVNVATGNVHIGNTLTVDGLSTLTGNATLSGFANIAGTLQVAGISTLNGILTANANATVNGTLTVLGGAVGILANTATGTLNDWAPGTLNGLTLIEWNGAANANVTGLAGGTTGQRITIKNTSSASILNLFHANTSSTASHRFTNLATSGPTPLAPGGRAVYVNDGTNWQLVEHEQGAPISYTPTWTNGSIGNGTLTASYVLRGRLLFWRFSLAPGSTTTFGAGGASDWKFSLPYTFDTGIGGNPALGSSLALQSGVANHTAVVAIDTGNVRFIHEGNGSNGYSGTVPWTWGTSDWLTATAVIPVT